MASRPWIVTALMALFFIGIFAAGFSSGSLAFPGGVLEPIWRLNPHAHENLARLGTAGPALMALVSVLCLATFVGLLRARRWGYRLAVAMLGANLLGDLVSSVAGIEPRAAIGVPIAALILWHLVSSPRVREHFFPSDHQRNR